MNTLLIIAIVVASVVFMVLLGMFLFSSNEKCTVVKRVLRDDKSGKLLNVPARRMWGWGAQLDALGKDDTQVGYCGEMSVQSTMIYYGNYVSQEQVSKAAKGPLLVSINEDDAYDYFSMDYTRWPDKPNVTINEILLHIKTQIDNNSPMIMGTFIVETEGDDSFDHIIPVIGYNSDAEGNVTEIIFNDDYQLHNVTMDCRLGRDGVPMCYKTRSEATDEDNNAPYINMIPNVEHKKGKDGKPLENAITSVKGNLDPNNELFPVMLVMNRPDEPDWGNEDRIEPKTPIAKPLPISCDVLISGLNPNKKYSLLRFDHPEDLPEDNQDFLESETFTTRTDFYTRCTTYKVHVEDSEDYPFMSDGTYFFRCVLNTSSTKSKFPVGTDRVDHKDLKLNSMVRRLRSPGSSAYSGVRLRAPMASRCQVRKPASNNIICGEESDGIFHRVWEWEFPPSENKYANLGCFIIKFDVIDYGNEMPVCLKLEIDTPGEQIDEDALAVVGEDHRLYVEDFASFYTLAYSLGPPNEDGSYSMISQDGRTRSELRPVR